jgi:hypothetical protein
MAKSETTIEQSMVRECRKHGGRAFKFIPIGFSGIPDRIVILPFVPIFFVEVKRVGGEASPLQRVMHAWLRSLGQEVYVLDSLDDFRLVIQSKLKQSLLKQES